MKNNHIDNLSINTIKTLAMDAVQKANSGHPGAPMGAAPMAYALWTNHLKHNPSNPSWINRDRFVLSPGHASMLLYSLLFLSGYELSIEDIKKFRQFDSKTPGHPEYGITAGVELTTGPLGAGFAMGIGMAIAESYLSKNINQNNTSIIDHFTFGIVSDGDLMEGVASEAASLAGTLQLGKIIYLYDDNKISIEGSTDLAFTENVSERFKAYNWQVIKIKDGTNIKEISDAIDKSKAENTKPTLIIVPTIIADGSPNKGGTADSHGAALGSDEVALTKQNIGWESKEDFFVPDEVLQHFTKIQENGTQAEKKWNIRLEEFHKKYPEVYEKWSLLFDDQESANWQTQTPEYEIDSELATRAASGDFLNYISTYLPNLIGGSADLGPSNNTKLKGKNDYSASSYDGSNMHFGVREHAMGNIINGIYLHGGLHAYAGTFLVFSDYMKPAIRLAAIQNLPAKFIFTHDSIGLGEDGPTHQPIEHIASLRTIPRLDVYRPADANETIACWKSIFIRNKPSAILLTRQKVKVVTTKKDAESGIALGAYAVCDYKEEPDAIILASGSEVEIAIGASQSLFGKGIKVRVVSMPCWEIFEEQSLEYKQSIIPDNIKARIAIEAGSSFGWHKYVQDSKNIISMNDFGASAPADELFAHFGFTQDNVIKKILSLLNKS
jgi:transketolase